jgi:nitrate reductase NapE component
MKSMMEDSSLVTGWGFRCGWLVSIAAGPPGSRLSGDQ